MKTLLPLTFIILHINLIFSQNIDENTPENAQPNNSHLEGIWKLDFSDEFNSNTVNENKWNIDNSTKSRATRPKIGVTDWRWKPENVSVENGNLVLKVYKTGNSSMTNGSINSHNKYLTKYGYFEVRIKVGDASKGTHTAFWLQSSNMSNVDGTANDGAEIDIFETAWTEDYTKSVVHIDGYGADHQANTKQYNTPGIHSGFHTWGFHWTESFMDIYYDGVFKVRYSNPKWVVKSLEFLWLSNGASFGVSGDQYFKDYPIGYLTETHVDYIRVWKMQTATDLDESLLKQDKWQLIMADSEDTEETGNPAVNAFDDNPNTFWHTEWKNNQPQHPHEIQIDLGEKAKIEAFKYLPRQDNNTNGNITQYEFYTTNDMSDWSPIASGNLDGDSTLKTVNFNETIECRYVKLVSLAANNGAPFANIAELYIKGTYPPQLNQDSWQLIMADSEDTEGTGNPAINAFDDNPSTFWFTDWANDQPTHPHQIQIDLGEQATIEAFKYLPRQDGKTNGNITQYEFYATKNLSDWGSPIAVGSFSGDDTQQITYFNEAVECQYIKLVALSDVNNSPFTNIAEVYLNGSYNSPLNTPFNTKTDFKVYPSPFKDELFLKQNYRGEYKTWQIFSINGILLKEGRIPISKNKINIKLDNLAPGLYVFNLHGNSISKNKIVIKE